MHLNKSSDIFPSSYSSYSSACHKSGLCYSVFPQNCYTFTLFLKYRASVPSWLTLRRNGFDLSNNFLDLLSDHNSIMSTTAIQECYKDARPSAPPPPHTHTLTPTCMHKCMYTLSYVPYICNLPKERFSTLFQNKLCLGLMGIHNIITH